MSGSRFDIRRAFGSGSSDCWSCVGVQPVVTSDRTQLPLMMAVGVGRGYDLRVLTVGGAAMARCDMFGACWGLDFARLHPKPGLRP
jgi:hypothetical protein